MKSPVAYVARAVWVALPLLLVFALVTAAFAVFTEDNPSSGSSIAMQAIVSFYLFQLIIKDDGSSGHPLFIGRNSGLNSRLGAMVRCTVAFLIYFAIAAVSAVVAGLTLPPEFDATEVIGMIVGGSVSLIYLPFLGTMQPATAMGHRLSFADPLKASRKTGLAVFLQLLLIALPVKLVTAGTLILVLPALDPYAGSPIPDFLAKFLTEFIPFLGTATVIAILSRAYEIGYPRPSTEEPTPSDTDAGPEQQA